MLTTLALMTCIGLQQMKPNLVIQTGHGGGMPVGDFHEGTMKMVTAGKDGVMVWDVRAKRKLFHLNVSGLVSDVEFSPSGGTLGFVQGDVYLWDPAKGSKRKLEANRWLYADKIAFSVDGKTIYAAGHSSEYVDKKEGLLKPQDDFAVIGWDVETGLQKFELVIENNRPFNVKLWTWSADDLYIGADQDLVKLNLKSGKVQWRSQIPNRPFSLAANPDQSSILCVDYKSIGLVNPRNGFYTRLADNSDHSDTEAIFTSKKSGLLLSSSVRTFELSSDEKKIQLSKYSYWKSRGTKYANSHFALTLFDDQVILHHISGSVEPLLVQELFHPNKANPEIWDLKCKGDAVAYQIGPSGGFGRLSLSGGASYQLNESIGTVKRISEASGKVNEIQAEIPPSRPKIRGGTIHFDGSAEIHNMSDGSLEILYSDGTIAKVPAVFELGKFKSTNGASISEEFLSMDKSVVVCAADLYEEDGNTFLGRAFCAFDAVTGNKIFESSVEKENHIDVIGTSNNSAYAAYVVSVPTLNLSEPQTATLIVVDLKSKKQVLKVSTTGTPGMRYWGDHFALISDKGSAKLFDLRTGKVSWQRKFGDFIRFLAPIRYFRERPDLQSDVVIVLADTKRGEKTERHVHGISMRTGEINFSFENTDPISYAQVMEDGSMIGWLTNNIIRHSADGKRIWKSAEMTSEEVFLISEKVIVANIFRGGLAVIGLEKGNLLHHIQGFTAEVTSADFVPGKTQVACGLADGNLAICDYETGKIVYTVIPLPDGGRIVMLPSGYYMADRGDVSNVGFEFRGRAYGFDQFDAFYNRPDIVGRELGWIPDKRAQLLEKAVQKRLEFSGQVRLGPETLPLLPKAEFENHSSLPVFTKSDLVQVKVRGISSQGNDPVVKAHIWVNRVPVSSNPIGKLVDVELSPGENHIEIAVESKSGLVSLRESAVVDCAAKFDDPKTVILIAGVSLYRNPQYNLKYAEKDANDLAAELKNFLKPDRSEFHVLTDSNATKSNILAWGDAIKNLRPHDRVVLYLAGHGSLTSELEYQFLPHDYDFVNGNSSGLRYSEIEELVSKSPARNRLILFDSCYSGIVEKKAKVVSVPVEQVPGSRSEIVSKVEFSDAFALMQTEFVNLDRGIGANVIAACRGSDVAFEMEGLKNGVMTAALLETLRRQGEITIADLRSSVLQRVSELSKGAQFSTVRVNNPDSNFRIK